MLTYPHFEPHFPRDKWTLPHVLEHQAVRRADDPFLSWTDAGRPYTFEETNSIVNEIASGFSRLNVLKGERVVLFLPNCLEFIFSWFALAKLGALEVAIGDSSKGAFLAHQLRLSDPRILITTAALARRLVEIESSLPRVTTCILVDTDEACRSPPNFTRIRTLAFSELRTGNSANPGIAIRPMDPAAVLFTSGTTGPSKGVVMSHSQHYFFAEEDCQLTGLVAGDVYMTGFPLFHGNAQLLTLYPCMIAGALGILGRSKCSKKR